MGNKDQLLFFGELPGGNIHGISISNSINLSILSEKYVVHVIEEDGAFKKNLFSYFRKICLLTANSISLIKKCIQVKYKYFYLVISLSFLGAVKTLTMILFFRILRFRGKVILHIHRGDFKEFISRNTVDYIIAILIIKLCEKVIFLSEKFVDPVLKKYTEISIIPNTILIPHPDKNYSRKQNFLYISNYIRNKGIIDLMEVMETLSDKEIVLETYGQFAENETTLLMKTYQSAKLKINGPITSETEKFAILGSAKCLILPSLNEGQPLIILEAMATGTPVIVTRAGDMEGLVGSDYPLLIDPGDKNALMTAILRVHNMKINDLISLSDNLSDRFRNLFSFDKHRNAMLSVFSD